VANDRLGRLMKALEASEWDALALIPGPNMLYVTGLNFHLLERPVVFLAAPGVTPHFILPELERAKAEGAGMGAKVFAYGEDHASWVHAFEQAGQSFGLAKMRVAVEPLRMRLNEMGMLEAAAPDVHLESGEAILADLRVAKSDEEIANMRQAVWVAEQALEAAVKMIQPGMTERDLASELTLELLRAGSDPELPFAPIVASGPNSALPHATPTERRLESGDLLVIDWGASVHGYFSDLSRTLALAPLDPELETIHRTVQAANQAARQAVKPGATCGAIDDAARQVIDAAGYGRFFIHRTGHGLGLEAHEPPFIRGGNPQTLEPGMTFTIEPGIYLTGRGGVRIEDDIVVGESDGESLSSLGRDLVVLG
jgi:Xaa-Pro aminopeptidase